MQRHEKNPPDSGMGFPYIAGSNDTRQGTLPSKETGCRQELYDFPAPGDVVDRQDYTSEGLHKANHSPGKFHAAIAITKQIRGIPG